MPVKIAIFFHGLLFMGEPPEYLPQAADIISEQMAELKASGLENAATEIHVGLNGSEESSELAKLLFPAKARVTYHGLASKAENLTIVMLENWVKTHPDWHVLYFHSKGATHAAGSGYGEGVSKPWRLGMMQDLVTNWRQCVWDLENHDVACSHFMRNMADGTQHIAAGNFWWATSKFLATVPSIFLRERIKQDGIGAVTSRYEAEVWISNGKIPTVKEYRPSGGGGVP